MKKTIQILDGGMGRELQRIGAPFQQPEWSALALMEAPEMVTQVHRNFIDAGADIITVNAYAVIPFHIGQERFDKDADRLTRLAVQCAQEAAQGTSTKIAGCVPPAFGTYSPNSFRADQVENILHPLIMAQKDDIDFWLIESMPSIREAESALKLVRAQSDKPIWLSLTLSDEEMPAKLRSLEKIQTFPGIDALLFNCSAPEMMENAVEQARAFDPDIPIGVYANNFAGIRKINGSNRELSQLRADITPKSYANFTQKWVSAGATIIGGCCGITPDHIAALSKLKEI